MMIMRQDILGLKTGIDSHLRIAALPSAMLLVAALTVPLQLRNPNIRFTVLSRPSNILLKMLQQREIDAGVTYLSNEPIGEVSSVPIYREEFLLLTTSDGPFGRADRVTWSQASDAPLCLLARDMQSRRIVDAVLRRVGIEPKPLMETDSVNAVIAHVSLVVRKNGGNVVPADSVRPTLEKSFDPGFFGVGLFNHDLDSVPRS